MYLTSIGLLQLDSNDAPRVAAWATQCAFLTSTGASSPALVRNRQLQFLRCRPDHPRKDDTQAKGYLCFAGNCNTQCAADLMTDSLFLCICPGYFWDPTTIIS